MNAKNKITLLFLLVISLSMYVTSLEPVSAANISINSSMNNSQIQTVLDNATSGDTINFIGSLYENIQLIINKTLNIVTSTGTTLTGSNPESAVFLINGSKASGTKISGFNITGSNLGILINNTSNVTISCDNVNTINGTAIVVNKSTGTILKDNSMKNSSTGINISGSANTKLTGNLVAGNQNGVNIKNSVNTTLNNTQIINNAVRGVGIYNSANISIDNSTIEGNGNNSTAGTYSDEGAVYLKSSNGIKISGSQIKENSQGITTEDSSQITINNNTIDDNYGEGILLNGSAKDISIKNNDLERNGNGIALNYNTSENISITGNMIANSVGRTLTGGSGHGCNYSCPTLLNTLTNFTIPPVHDPIIYSTVKPTIAATSTKNKAIGVSRTKAAAVRFSKNIFKSVNWSKVYIKNLKTGQKCKITKWVQGNHIYISTNSKKAANTWYQVYIPSSAIKDSSGNKLAKSYTWKFKTGKY